MSAIKKASGWIAKLSLVILLGATVMSCAPVSPQNVNAPAFARRAPLPGRPDYVETIKYINDGVKYAYPTSAFFVSPDGRMCFRGVFNPTPTIFDIYNYDWCVSPTELSRVETIRNTITGIPQIMLSCKHTYPGCAHEVSYYHRSANMITIEIVPSAQEKYAIENLIYLMGGNLGDRQPFGRYSSAF